MTSNLQKQPLKPAPKLEKPFPTVDVHPAQFPHGLLIVDNFFTPEEQDKIMQIVDAHPFSQLIHRYG